jgi:L-asparaginase
MVRLVAFSNPRAALVSLYPGFDARLIDAYVAMDFRGLVLQAFGQGNGPTDTPAFASALQRAVERGVVVCAVTECLRGATVTAYGTGLGPRSYEAVAQRRGRRIGHCAEV